MATQKAQAHWSSRWAFLMAAVGSAVGLGNIWKFPYEAGQGGGGAFVLIYLAFVFLIGTPVLIAELSLGRRGQLSPIGTMRKLAAAEGRSPLWQLVGWSGVIGAFIVISFYSLVGGWTLSYMADAAQGAFTGMDKDAAGALFGNLLENPVKMIFWHGVFMAITIFIVAKGIQGGLEKAASILMPALFVLLFVLVIYAAIAGDFSAAARFLFQPDFSKLTVRVMLEALGQSFFSLSLALGSMMTYGAYLTRTTHIGRSALLIASADTSVALLAGLAIFPIVFAYGLDIAGGPSLIFATLPIAFGQMPLGVIVGTSFFALLAVAAITSSISLLEPPVSYIVEVTKFSRRQVSISLGLTAFALGILSALSQGHNALSDVSIFGRTIMDFKDYLTNNIMMPLAGLFTALFVGWFASRKSMMDELAMEESWFKIWYFLIRFICPLAIGVIFVFVAFGLGD